MILLNYDISFSYMEGNISIDVRGILSQIVYINSDNQNKRRHVRLAYNLKLT